MKAENVTLINIMKVEPGNQALAKREVEAEKLRNEGLPLCPPPLR